MATGRSTQTCTRRSKFIKTLSTPLTRITDDQAGQALTEYALIVVVVALVAVAALTLLGGHVTSVLSKVGSSL